MTLTPSADIAAMSIAEHGRAIQEALELFVERMRVIRQIGAKEGALADNLDIFIPHVELVAQKPDIYAQELAKCIRDYTTDIEEADRALY